MLSNFHSPLLLFPFFFDEHYESHYVRWRYCHKDYFTTSCQSRLFSPCCSWLLRAHPKIEISLTPSLDTTSLPYSLASAYLLFLPSLDSDKSNNVYYHLSFIFFTYFRSFFSYLKLI